MGRLDHFVIAGAQRCGTTYLYGLLDEHPDIEMVRPVRPEPKFFLAEERCAEGYEAYRRLFSDNPSRVVGEKSTSYVESEVAISRIAALLPNVIVVVMLRDPVERAISNYRFSVEHGTEDLPIDEALHDPRLAARPFDTARISVSPYAYLQRGQYVDYLEPVVRHIPRSRLITVVFEELIGDAAVLGSLYERLGVDSAFRPSSWGVPANRSEGSRPTGETIGWLREYYRAPNAALERFLGRAISVWPRA